MSRRQNQWFVPGDGIAREVITADIQRYLGPDALVKPGNGTGDNEGVAGYWITAYRTLTTQMIQDLKLDSQRWRQEAGRVAYKDSRTHESRQYYGPSQTTAAPVEYPQSNEPPRQTYQSPPAHYPTSEQHYTHVPQQQPSYQAPQSGYTQYHPPRTTQPTSYGGYTSQEPERQSSYQSTNTPQYSYYQQPSSEPPRQPPVYAQQPTSTARPGFYIASDGREYPLSAQPQQAQQPAPNSGRRRG